LNVAVEVTLLDAQQEPFQSALVGLFVPLLVIGQQALGLGAIIEPPGGLRRQEENAAVSRPLGQASLEMVTCRLQVLIVNGTLCRSQVVSGPRVWDQDGEPAAQQSQPYKHQLGGLLHENDSDDNNRSANGPC